MTEPPLSPQFELALKWARELQLGIEPLEAKDGMGNPIPARAIIRGQLRFSLIEVTGILHLVCDISVPSEVRSAVGRLTTKLQEEMLQSLRQALMDSQRVGWIISPVTTSKIGDLEGVRLEQAFRISATEVQSFNRFVDAFAEISTAAVRSSSVFGVLIFSAGPQAAAAVGPRPGYG
ncbi:MAG: hypothetical protein L3K00_08025 [Thermoplasmata archaeon]|nr:hypothetical protein [Thermoplasmata archaeon]